MITSVAADGCFFSFPRFRYVTRKMSAAVLSESPVWLVSAVSALGVLAPVLPGQIASSPGKFYLIYSLFILVALGSAAGLVYASRNGSLENKKKYENAGGSMLPLAILAALAVAYLSVSGTQFQRVGSSVFALVHSLVIAGLMSALYLLSNNSK